jgi:hypothetical protein
VRGDAERRKPYILQSHQAHLVSQRAQLARPEVCCGTGLHADQSGRHGGRVGDDLSAPEAALHDGVARLVHTVDLEDMLGQVEADWTPRKTTS